MKLEFEYGKGMVTADLTGEDVDVFIPGETVADPDHLPEDQLEQLTLDTIRNPYDLEPISKAAKPGDKITIIFPDRVKGGEQETAHRKLSIKAILSELKAAGVHKKDILLICSNGLHKKNTSKEIYNILGPEIFNEFDATGQIINHDSEDYDNLIDLGKTEEGDPVIMNRYVYESDMAFLIGHTQGNPYGGYSGGYKHCSTGITHWKTIATNHVPKVMHKPDFVPVNSKSTMRHKFDIIGMHMEEKMGKKFFCIDAVLDTKSRQIEIHAGSAKRVQQESWKMGDKRTYVPFAEEKYNVMIFGIPQDFHYGPGMGTNPIMMMQAISAQVVRHKRVMADNCVIIAASACDGYFNELVWPYTRELHEIFVENDMQTLPDMNDLGEYFANRQDYIDQYRFGHAYHPFHGFSMMSSAHIAERDTAAIYITGARKPGIARSMGMKTRSTIEEALADAKKKIVGPNPKILALPGAFTRTATHLMMKNETI